MTIRILYLLFTVGIILISCQKKHTASTQERSKRDALLSALEKFNTAFAESNLGVLDTMVTENYLHTNSSSKVIGKEAWFNYLKKRDKNIKSGEISVLDYRLEDTNIEYHGKTAIVTGRVTVKTKDSLGEKQNQYRITNVWVYENDQWKRAGFHDGKIE